MLVNADILDNWLRARLGSGVGARAESAWPWLAESVRTIPATGGERQLFLTFSSAARRCGKSALSLTAAERAQLTGDLRELDVSAWTLDQAVRLRLLLAFPSTDAKAWLAVLDRLFAAADLGESVALYQGLSLLPHAKQLTARAAEGVRSSTRGVFIAVALGNPFPAKMLDEDAWNQLVLKAVFVEADLNRIVGLDARGNTRLMRMLCDYARERLAAKRPVPPLLWRGVGAHADDAAVADLVKLANSSNEIDQHAAVLALSACSRPAAKKEMAARKEMGRAISAGRIAWANLPAVAATAEAASA